MLQVQILYRIEQFERPALLFLLHLVMTTPTESRREMEMERT